MLTLILGPDHKVYRQEVLNCITDNIKNGIGGQYLIVPEQYSFDTERLLCSLGGDTTSRFAEVLSFSRLAGRVECACGGTALVWLDHGGRLLTAAQAVEHVHSKLKLYAGVCRRAEFLETFLNAVDEFGSYGITPEKLTELSARHRGQFAQKLEEIGLLYESYLAVCTQANEPTQRLRNLRDVLLREDYAEEHEYYVCGFTDFTLLEREIIESLVLSAKNITVALPYELAGGRNVFPSAVDTAQQLKKFCNKNNIAFTEKFCGFDESVPADLLHLQCSISNFGASVYQEPAEHIQVRQFRSVEEECRYAADEILRLRKNGAKYRDVAVACANLSGYASALRKVFERSGIAYHLSEKKPLSENAGARILLCGVRAVAEGLDRDAVLDYIKCGATGLPQDACDRLVNYARMWNIRGSGWLQPWEQHPNGIRDDWSPEEKELLQSLNTWKTEGLQDLFLLRESIRSASNVGEMVRAVADFADRMNLAEKLQGVADALFRDGEHDKAQQYGQIYDILLNALEQMYLIIPDAVRSADEFCTLLEKLLNCYSVSTVPSSVEQVSVGDLAAFRGKTVRHLLVLGCDEGVFPAQAGGIGVFTEEERRVLMEEGISMAPLRVDVLDRDLGNIYLAMRSASHSAYFSCCSKEPSHILVKAEKSFAALPPATIENILLDRKEWAAQLAHSGAQVDPSLSEDISFFRQRGNYSFGIISPEQIAKLYGKNISLSASKIDKFSSCRFAFFLHYGLKAEPLQEVTFDASEFGTFVHDVLENTAREVMEKGGFHQVQEGELLQIANRHMDAYEARTLRDLTENNARFCYLFRRNREEALSVVRDLGAELRNSDFEPAAFELHFGRDGDMDSIAVEGSNANSFVMGYVDRVDLYRDGDDTFVRVVDYKTGNKQFDYADISVGEGMQMLIYLFALCKNGEKLFGKNLHPAGVLYHPSRQVMVRQNAAADDDSARKLHQEETRRRGLVLDDARVVNAMEHFEDAPAFLPIKAKKDGSLSGDLASRKEIKLLEEHVFGKLREITDGICGGVVEPNPIIRDSTHSACTWCDFREVCLKGFVDHRERPMREISNREFFEELAGREAGNDGKN